MRLVRSYALRVKQMPLSPEPTTFGAFPPPQGDSFIDRGRGGSFRDRFLSTEAGSFRDRGGSFRSEHFRRRRQSLASPRELSRERCPEPFTSILREEKTPERAPNVLAMAASMLVARLIAEAPAPPCATSDESRCPPGARGSFHRRLPPLLPSDMADKPVKPVACTDKKVAAPPAARHSAVPRRRRSSMSDIISNSSSSIHARRAAPLACLIPDALPHAPSASSSGKRFHVRGGVRPSAQLTEEFCY